MTLSFAEFQGTQDDEAVLAAEVAALYGAEHTVRVVSEEEFRSDLPKILEAVDQPSIDGVNTWFVAKAARELGLKLELEIDEAIPERFGQAMVHSGVSEMIERIR